ncbi:MAG: hypothetical protein ACP6IP_09110 [Candidatus Njordarchaeia archaeon]
MKHPKNKFILVRYLTSLAIIDAPKALKKIKDMVEQLELEDIEILLSNLIENLKQNTEGTKVSN